MRTPNSLRKNLTFDYDAMGNRIAKHIELLDGTRLSSTYYILDAQGNPLAMYELDYDASSFELTERQIYGSARLGSLKTKVDVFGSAYTAYSDVITTHAIGDRNYELSNHLGNVLTVISDKLLPVDDGNGAVASYSADLVMSCDYSPFGVALDGRGVEGSYRYGFQGQEMDDEIKGQGNSVNYKYRMHDPRVGRFFAVDPLSHEYPFMTTYQFSSNSTISMKELEGLEGVISTTLRNGTPVVGFNGESSNQNEVMFAFPNSTGGTATITRPLSNTEAVNPAIIREQRTASQNSSNVSTNVLQTQDGWVNVTSFTDVNKSRHCWNIAINLDPANQTTTTVSSDFGQTPNSNLAPTGFTAVQNYTFLIAGGATSFTATFDALASISNSFLITDNLGNVYTPQVVQAGAAFTVTMPVLPGATSFTVSVGGVANNPSDQFQFSVTTVGPNNSAVSIAGVSNTVISGSGIQTNTTIETTPIAVNPNATSTSINPLNNE